MNAVRIGKFVRVSGGKYSFKLPAEEWAALSLEERHAMATAVMTILRGEAKDDEEIAKDIE